MRIAEKVRYCSSCFAQDPELEYVDMEAYWDGPVVNEDADIKNAIDDLVICEKCLRNAARLVGMVYDEELKQENKELGKLVEAQSNQLEIKEATIVDLSSALEHANKLEPLPKRAVRNGN